MTTQDTPTQRNRPETTERTDSRESTRERPDRSAGRRRLGVTADSRGVSEVLGAILIFGLLIALLVLIQVNAVPAQNQQVEFEHNQRVEQDMLGLDRAILQSGMLDVPGSSEIELAAHYPSRFFLINPGVGAGTIETLDSGTVTIQNAHMPSTTNYWNTDTDKSFGTTSFQYRPNYKEYASAPVTVYEHNTLANVFENGNVSVDSGGFIDGNQITLVMVNGSLSHAGSRGYTVETTPISAPAQTVTLESDTPSDAIVITLPTGLPESHWSTVLSDEERVRDFEVTGGILRVELEPGNYELRMADVAIGGSAPETRLKARYLAALNEPRTESIRPGETKELRVQIRDRLNNPGNGTVKFNVTTGNGEFLTEDGTPVDTLNVPAAEDGTASAIFRATTVGEPEVTATIVTETRAGTTRSERSVTYTIDISEAVDEDSDDAISRINPDDTINVTYTGQGNNDHTINFTNNIGGQVRIDEVRATFFISQGTGDPELIEFTNTDGDPIAFRDSDGSSTNRTEISGDWYSVAFPTVWIPESGETQTQLRMTFYEKGKKNPTNAVQGTLGLAIEYRTNSGTFTENYFIQLD